MSGLDAFMWGLVLGAVLVALVVVRRYRLPGGGWTLRPSVFARELAKRTAEAVGKQIGAQPELVSTTTSAPAYTIGRRLSPSEEARLEQEVPMRVEAAIAELRHVQQAQAKAVDERMQAIEEKFPDAVEFQKYADANQLFLVYQIGELTKRLDRLEGKQVGRLQIAAWVVGLLVTAAILLAAILTILQLLGVLKLPTP